MGAEYKLVYFNTQGLAEPIRYIFALAGVSYEDERLPKDEHWPLLVPEVKARFPWGTVPVLYHKDLVLSQSLAIARYLANKFNLVGADDYEAAQCDEIIDSVKDFTSEWRKFFHEPDAQKKLEMKTKLESEWNPKYFKIYNDILVKQKQKGKDDGGWIVGSSTTWADVCLAHVMMSFGNRQDCSHLESYPELKKYVEKFHELPAIKKWMSTRPVTI